MRRPLRRLGLGLFFVSVACNAVIGMYALLAPGFGETEGKVLGTSLYVTAALLLVLACEPALERRLIRPVPLVASACGTVAFALLIAIVWMGDDPPEVLLKVMGTAMTVAVAGMLASLLALARLERRYALVSRAAFVLTAVAAAAIVLAIWLEPSGSIYVRSLGALLVALAALVVTIPVLHRLSRADETPTALEPAAADAAIAFCPGCGAPLPAGTGSGFTCAACGRCFTVLAGPSLAGPSIAAPAGHERRLGMAR